MDVRKLYSNPFQMEEIFIRSVGRETLSVGRSQKRMAIDIFAVVYCVSGNAQITSESGNTFKMKRGTGYVDFPRNEIQTITALTETELIWIGFNGTKAESLCSRAGLTRENPFFVYEDDALLRNILKKNIEMMGTAGFDFRALGTLLILLATLADSNARLQKRISPEDYVTRTMDYIALNYMHKVSVREIAEKIGLDRSYLYTLFKKSMSVSIQEYLINYRMQMAADIMNNKKLTITEIAEMTGYSDVFAFSKTFKKTFGMSPSDYRKQL